MIICLLLEVSLAWFYKWRDRALVGLAVARGRTFTASTLSTSPAGARMKRSESSSTPTGVRRTRRTRSPSCVANSGSGGQWERVGPRFGDVASEAFISSPEQEVLSRHEFENTRQVQAVVLDRHYRSYNHKRRHSTIDVMSPSNYENTTTSDQETIHDLRGTTASPG